MYLSQIRISGFKSFLENTTIELQKNKIAVIVGPNGCGKSNVFDAVRWAIGEGGSKLRVEKADNIIFSGSENFASVNLAQVHLHFINDQEKEIPKYGKMHEFQISRKLFRDGNNQYFINQSPCRLLDVKTLLMDLGLSYSGYSFIEQGSVTQIIQSKPEEKRQIIEEAAGLMKFKTLKKDAENKLNNTEQNLSRIEDRRVELEEQEKKLSKQAEVVDDYLEVKGKIEFLKKMTLAFQWRNAKKSLEEAIQNRESALNDFHRERQTKIENDLILLRKNILEQKIKGENYQKNYQDRSTVLQQAQNEWQINQKLFQESEGWMNKAKEERESIKAQIETKKQELANLQKTIFPEKILVSQLEEYQAQEQKLEQKYQESLLEKEELLALEKNIVLELEKKKNLLSLQKDRMGQMKIPTDFLMMRQELAKKWSEKKREKQSLEQQQKEKIQQTQNLQKIEQELQSLQKLQREVEQQKNLLQNSITQINQKIIHQKNILANADTFAGLKQNFMEQKKELGFVGFVSDLLQVKKTATRGVFHFLDFFFDTVLFTDKKKMPQIIKILEQNSIPRLQFVFLDEIPLQDFQKGENFSQELLFSKNLPKEYNEKLQRFFAIVKKTGTPQENQLFYNENFFSNFPYLLEYNAVQKKTLSEKYTNWKKELSELEEQLKNLEEQKQAKEKQEIESQLLQKEKEFVDCKDKLQQILDEQAKSKENYWKLEADYKQMQQKIQRFREFKKEEITINSKIKELEQEIRGLENQQKELGMRLEKAKKNWVDIQDQFEKSRKKKQEEQNKITNLDSQKKFQQTNIQNTQRDIDYLENSLKQKEKQILEWQKSAKTKEELASLEQTIQKYKKQKNESFEQLEQHKKLWIKLEEDKKEKEQQKEEIQQKINEVQKIYYQTEANISQYSERVKNLEEQIQEQFATSGEEILRYFDEKDFEPVKAKEELQKLQRKMVHYASVNLGAKEEHKEVYQKLKNYNQQKKDLEESLLALRESISEIEKNSKEAFYSTYHRVNEHFQKLFSIIFQGGKANLVLENEQDILTSGVEIYAQPRGKKMQNWNLFSSGEKSLIGLVFIFSILNVNPSIFCFLDEVDAALDSVNVERIISVIQEIGKQNQIVMITHNQKTVLVGELLLGVTMQNEGVSRVFSLATEDYKLK